jgi:tight adherence protein B
MGACVVDERGPSVMVLLVALLAGIGALGAIVFAGAWTPAPAKPVETRESRLGELLAPLTAAIIGAAFALVVTGWVTAALAGAVAGYAAVKAWRNRGGNAKQEQDRITALASWCEQLRDLLSAEHGIIGTIVATSKTCPDPIKLEVTRLATRLSRQHPTSAIRQFAGEVNDPSGDLIASVLLLAMSRSSRTSELLSELALTIRERAAMRLRVEADRSGQRSEARFIVGFSAIVVAGVLIFGHDSDFLDAYDDASGQLVFGLVALFFGLGGWWMSRLTRFTQPARFLSIGEEEDEL